MLTVNRTYKSTLFIMLFEDKKNLLELYNAISGKHYTDPELLGDHYTGKCHLHVDQK